MSSSLLIDEPPLIVLNRLANAFGLNEAIVLQQVHFLINPKTNRNFFEGRHWVWNSYSQWRDKYFTFWSERTIRRIFDGLEEKKLILISEDDDPFRKVKYYSVDYDVLNQVLGLQIDVSAITKSNKPAKKLENHPSSENGHIDVARMDRRCVQSGQLDVSKVDGYIIDTKTPSSENILITPLTPHDLKISDEEKLNQIRTKEAGGVTKHNLELLNDLASDLNGQEKNTVDQLERSCPPISTLKPTEAEEEHLSQKMIKVWNLLVQPKIKDAPRKELILTDQRKKALEELFNGILNGDFAEWERYCSQIAETQFLLGNNERMFRVSLEWALCSSNALKVLEGRIYDKPQSKTQVVKDLAQVDFEVELLEHFTSKGYPKEWLKVYQLLCKSMGQKFFRSWLKGCSPLPVRANHAVLLAPTRFQRDYLNINHFNEICDAARRCWPDLGELTIEVKA